MGLEMGTLPTEYSEAMRSVRVAKHVLWWLTTLAIAIQIAVFVLVAFVGVLNSLSPEARMATSAPAVDAALFSGTQDTAYYWKTIFVSSLALTKFLALAFSILLALTLLMSVNIAMVGRLGGVGAMMGAFFWSLLLIAFMIPWQHIFNQPPFNGALFEYKDLHDASLRILRGWGAVEVSRINMIVYYVQFLLCPIVAFLLLLVSHLRFRSSCRKMIVAAATPQVPR
jgi:hypothetical protein